MHTGQSELLLLLATQQRDPGAGPRRVHRFGAGSFGGGEYRQTRAGTTGRRHVR